MATSYRKLKKTGSLLVAKRTSDYEYTMAMGNTVLTFSVFVGLLVTIVTLIGEKYKVLGVGAILWIISLFILIKGRGII